MNRLSLMIKFYYNVTKLVLNKIVFINKVSTHFVKQVCILVWILFFLFLQIKEYIFTIENLIQLVKHRIIKRIINYNNSFMVCFYYTYHPFFLHYF